MEWDIVFGGEVEGLFKRWKKRTGEFLPIGAPILQYESQGKTLTIKAEKLGTISSLNQTLSTGSTLTKGMKLGSMKPCEHTVVIKDMCADCGFDLRLEGAVEKSEARVPMIHSIPELHISEEEAKRQGTEDEKNLLAHEKLVLLVDLDQTLIHTTNEAVKPDLKDVEHFYLSPPGQRRLGPEYHTKLRPHAREFLRHLSDLYQLHICTFGIRLYAHTVARILDPTAELFDQRILSRDECFDPSTKAPNLKFVSVHCKGSEPVLSRALFPCGDHMVCIIDDREDVWNFARNVVHVKPYRFFKHTGDIHAPPGYAKEEEPSDEESCDQGGKGTSSVESDDEGYLPHLEKILKRIHVAFYQIHRQKGEADMKTIVPYVKSKVLRDCHLVFSGVIPTNQKEDTSPIYRAAIAFGATVQNGIISPEMVRKDPELHPTTHLIAAKRDTRKYHEAKKLGIAVVSPQWLWFSVERWERGGEELFPLTSEAVSPTAAATGGFHYQALSVKEFVPPEQEAEPGGEGSAPAARVAERHLANFPSFSHDQMDRMSHEVEDELLDEDESGDEGGENAGGGKRKLESIDEDEPQRKQTREEESSDGSNHGEDSSGDSIGSIDDEMAEALEREFGPK